MSERLESPAPVIVLLGAAIGLLALIDLQRRRLETSRARAFRRLELELEAANERAQAAEGREQALLRQDGPRAVPEPGESVTRPEEPGDEAGD